MVWSQEHKKNWVGPHIYSSKLNSWKHNLHNKPCKHAGNNIFIYLSTIFFVGPHFCTTKLCLNRVTKVGVLQSSSWPTCLIYCSNHFISELWILSYFYSIYLDFITALAN
jgi:hypothetical protein